MRFNEGKIQLSQSMVLEKLHAHDFKVKQSNMNFDLSFTVYLKKKKSPKLMGLHVKWKILEL